jgi:hypothetical protein
MVAEVNAMTATRFETELDQNKVAWNALRDQVRREFAGKFVALAFGRIVGSDSRVDRLTASVEALDPKPIHYEIFPAEADPLFDTVESISSEILAE